jgi:hypothetical protein
LRQLDEFLEETLKKHAANDVIEANQSIATIVLRVEAVTSGGETFFATTASGVVIYWQRLATGVSAVKQISQVEAESQ